jgi:hypothetical protein
VLRVWGGEDAGGAERLDDAAHVVLVAGHELGLVDRVGERVALRGRGQLAGEREQLDEPARVRGRRLGRVLRTRPREHLQRAPKVAGQDLAALGEVVGILSRRRARLDPHSRQGGRGRR